MPRQPSRQQQGAEGGSQRREPSNRTRKRNARAAAHQALQDKAERLRLGFVIRWWARSTPTPPSSQQRQTLLAQQEQGDSRAQEKRTHESPTGAESPVHRAPAKSRRALVLHPHHTVQACGPVDGLPGAGAASARCASPLRAQPHAGAGEALATEQASVCAGGAVEGGGPGCLCMSPQIHTHVGHMAQPAWGCPASSQPPVFASTMSGASGPGPSGGTDSYEELPPQLHAIVAHMRAHEYPQFVYAQVRLGLSQAQAHAIWVQQELGVARARMQQGANAPVMSEPVCVVSASVEDRHVPP